MNVTVNGTTSAVAERSTIADLVRNLGRDPLGRGMAVARNGEVVPRAEWETTGLDDGDRIEVLSAARGG